jgi:hypothetical protein
MSSMAQPTTMQDSQGPDQAKQAPYNDAGKNLLSLWSERRRQARNARKAYEPTWHICQSFLAGRQWVEWSGEGGRTGRVIEMPNPNKRERHTVNVLTQYVATVMGKLYVEDLRPDILFKRSDIESENIATHTQAVGKYIWDVEADAERSIHNMLLKKVTYGTAAVRCFYDTSAGEAIGDFPIGPDGKPILDLDLARAYVAQQAQLGSQVRFKTLKAGQITWEELSPFQILPPPGIADETWFPWLIVERPMPVEWIKMRWPDSSMGVREQSIESIDQLTARSAEAGASPTATPTTSLKGHALVSTGYQMPSDEYPAGRVVTFIDATSTILAVEDQLPYHLKGRPHHGIVFFHYHRVPGRFWSVGVVEPLVGPQKQKNRARSQMIEMKDRNLGRVYARKGTITASNKPVGKIMELIEIPLHADFPQETQGVPPGPWIENESRMNDDDMQKVAGLNDVSMGGTPSGISAYSSLALLAEQDSRRMGPILKTLRIGLGDVVLLSLELAKAYWPSNKQFAIAGTDGKMEVFNYQRSQLPQEFYVNVSGGGPMPTSPAVESQKIFDIFNAATSAGQPLPVDWLKSSLDQGRALPIPKAEAEVQRSKAEQENLMLSEGMMVQPAYFDDDYLHIQVHRDFQIGLAPTDQQVAMMVEQHIQMHAQAAQMKKPTQQDQVPQMQGGHGIEAQNGQTNQQGLAQSKSGGGAPTTPSQN